nr:thiol peroxidase [Natranaerovirga pectinivora]
MKKNGIVKFGGNPVMLLGEEVNVGQKAENFTAVKNDLSVFDFYKETEGKNVIISVVPSVDTGVCEQQTVRFNQEASNLSNDVVIITISVDLPFAQSRFCGAQGIENSIVVSDHKELDFGSKYGFVIEEFRLLARGILVIDKERTLKFVEYVSEVTNHPDYDAALKVVQQLS